VAAKHKNKTKTPVQQRAALLTLPALGPQAKI